MRDDQIVKLAFVGAGIVWGGTWGQGIWGRAARLGRGQGLGVGKVEDNTFSCVPRSLDNVLRFPTWLSVYKRDAEGFTPPLPDLGDLAIQP